MQLAVSNMQESVIFLLHSVVPLRDSLNLPHSPAEDFWLLRARGEGTRMVPVYPIHRHRWRCFTERDTYRVQTMLISNTYNLGVKLRVPYSHGQFLDNGPRAWQVVLVYTVRPQSAGSP